MEIKNYWANENNYTKGRRGTAVKEITIHHMAGVLSAKQCGAIFQNPNRAGSSHYGIGVNGEIGRYVSESDIAWTNSNWEANKRAITIEVSNNTLGPNWAVSDASLNSLIELVRDIAKRYNLLPLVKGKSLTWHKMYSNTNCPGPYLMNKLDYIVERVNAGTEENKTSNTVEELARRVIAGDFGNGAERKVALGIAYNEVQKRVNEILLGNKPKVDINALADAVIRGEYGNGEERKRRLGANYNVVQAEINRRYGL